ncbi:hypothetical protein J1614_005828, partial [Plenodomus biglobosus]
VTATLLIQLPANYNNRVLHIFISCLCVRAFNTQATMSNRRNMYDASRDPRALNRQGSNVDMANAAPQTVITSEDSKKIDEQLSQPGASSHEHCHSVQQLQDRTKDLLNRIALQEADNAKLQKTKAATKDELRNTHARLNKATTSLATLTVSYAKRLDEKHDFMSQNADLELTNSTCRDTIAARLRIISDNETQIQGLQKENRELMSRLDTLASEMVTLKQRLDQFEVGEIQETRHGDDRQQRHQRAGRGEYMGRGEAYRPRYGGAINRGRSLSARGEERGRSRKRSKADSDERYL